MAEIRTYYQYDEVPVHIRRQWCRMHIQRFPHVPNARRMWRKRTKAVLCLLIEKDKLLAWCMYIKRRSGLEMYTYTRRGLRGKGFGKQVASAGKLKADDLWPNRVGALFFPHDDKSSALYVSLGWYEPEKKKRQRSA